MKKVRYIHKKGQPLLIGARNVETAHQVARLLDGENLPYQLLSAADHKAEAEKIAKAGQEDMITIATNMAGRGTDILLGPGVEGLGGLFVLGTERHESRRIDDQLAGRSGRQGEAGESQFLISMEDEIMQVFGSEKIIDVMEQYDIPEDEYISGQGLSEAFKRAQDFVESRNYDSRIYLYKYDSVSNYQRKFLYELRNRLLQNPEGFTEFVKTSVKETVEHIFSLGDAQAISKEMQEVFSLAVDPGELRQLEELKPSNEKKKRKKVYNEWLNPFYGGGKASAGQFKDLPEAVEKSAAYLTGLVLEIKKLPEVWEASQSLILEIIDNQWSVQLDLTEVLKEEAGLLSYASEDPLIEFVLESRNLFEHMLYDTKRQFLKAVFLLLSQKGMLE
jgi:preprotein translocase subunit SecA